VNAIIMLRDYSRPVPIINRIRRFCSMAVRSSSSILGAGASISASYTIFALPIQSLVFTRCIRINSVAGPRPCVHALERGNFGRPLWACDRLAEDIRAKNYRHDDRSVYCIGVGLLTMLV
jgi:hypothetical protein